MDHEQREVRCIGDPWGGDMHEIFQTPVRFGIPEVKLDVAPPTLVVHQGRVGQCQITAERDDMGLGRRTQVGFENEDDSQRVCELLGQQWRLVPASVDRPFHGSLWEGLLRPVSAIHLAAIGAAGTSPDRGAGGGEVPGRIVPQFGNQGQVALPRHLQGVVVAEVTVQPAVGQRDNPSDQF